MNSEILGNIETISSESPDYFATIKYGSRSIRIQIIPDDQRLETTLKLAADVVSHLNELDKVATRIIVEDLRGTYNSAWNEYDEVQEDGSLKTISNPQLSESQFEKSFSLTAVNVTGGQVVDLFYEDSGLFWGHSVVVTSLHGTDFTEAHAELFG